jgi:nucleoside-diphosphate kinase
MVMRTISWYNLPIIVAKGGPMMEQTVVLIKPDGMEKHVVGQVIDRFERAGLTISALKLVQLTQDILDTWYAHHKDKPFFPELSKQMMSTPVAAMVLSGEGAIQKVFDICGPTDPAEAAPGTIRKDFGVDKPHNVVHRSDSVEAAKKEIGLLFAASDLH